MDAYNIINFVPTSQDPPSIVSYASDLSFVVVALSLSAIGDVLAHRRCSAPDVIRRGHTRTMMGLKIAAEAASACAQRERMAIATVAERSGDVIAWFARSIAGVVAVYRQGTSGDFEKLGSTSVAEDLHSLYIRKRDYPSYLSWARSVQ